MVLSSMQRILIANAAYSLPGHCSPTKKPRRAHPSDATETIQIGLASYENTMGSNEHGDRHETTRSRPVQGRDTNRDGRFGGRSAARHDRAAGDSYPAQAHSSRSRSPTKRSHSPDKIPGIPRSSTVDSSLAARRAYNNKRPSEMGINSTRQDGSVSAKAVLVHAQPQHQSQQAAMVSPSTPPLRRLPGPQDHRQGDRDEDDVSSYYSEDDFGQAHPSYVSPLRVRKATNSENGAMKSYNRRGRAPSPNWGAQSASPQTRSPQHRALQKTATIADLRADEPPSTPRNYSPLSDYLSSQVMPVRKELVGAKGWLERTRKPSDKAITIANKKDALSQKKLGFLNNLRKLAKDVTLSAKDITSSASRKSRDKEQKVSRLTVSLDPREQSLLYCELEFLLTTALDGYVNSQFNAGRLDADKYKKIVDGWQQRGRPKVVGFRYDLETQLDLVMLHSEDFRFYGKRAGLLAAVNGVLDMIRVDARAMRIRTFCQPDTVIAKQLLDAQSLFNLIGCCEQQQIQLAEVIQFFKVILEREQNYRQIEAPGQPRQEEQQRHSSGGTETEPYPDKKSQRSKDTTSPRNYDSF